jgi:hypothetical protein
MSATHVAFPARQPRGDQAARGGRRGIGGGFLTFLLLIIAAAIVWSYITQPKPGQPTCPVPGQPCVAPPRPPTGAPQLRLGTVWQSSELGFGLEYSPRAWEAAEQDGRGIRLDLSSQALSGMGFSGGQAIVVVRGVPASEATPDQLVSQEVDLLRQSVPDIEADDRPGREILGPEIGYQPGTGGVYVGTTDGAAGGAVPVSAAVVSASDGRLSTLFVLVVIDPGVGTSQRDLEDAARTLGDSLINAVSWPAAT